MRNLVRAALVRYMSDSVAQLAAIAALIFGVLFSISAGVSGYSDDLNVDLKQFLIGMILMLIAIVLSVGREYKDRTIRNKLIVGNTRAQVLGAEILAAMIVALLFCALTVLPLLFNWKLLQTLPLATLGKWAASMLGMFLICAAIGTAVTLLVGHRTYAILTVGAAVWCVFAVGYLGEGLVMLSENRYQTRRVYHPENPAEILTEYEEKNPYYLPQPVRYALMCVNNVNPCAVLAQTQYLFDCTGKSSQDADASASLTAIGSRMTFMLPEQLLCIAAVTALGVRGFKRKDIR